MQKVSKIIFLILATLCAQLYCSTAYDATSTDLKTPQRLAPTATVEPTPGQLVSQRQAEVLTKERFAALIGEDIINSWGIEWHVFADPTLAFDAPQKSRAISVIHNKMNCLLKKRFDEEFMALYGSVAVIRGQREAVHADRLDMLAIKYFTELYPEAKTIESLDKQGGVQLGERIKVTFPDETTLLYHVKTHSEGRLSEKSTAPKLVNPQELLAYKILELLGFGCEVHFFEKSPEDVYIATLDASFVSKTKRGEFNVFHKAAGDLGRGNDAEYGQSIWGTLHSVIKSIKKEGHDTDWSLVEDEMTEDKVATNFMNQQATLDILTRIMRLCDLLNNPENFGFISCGDIPPKLKVIDFRVMDPRELVLEDSDFRGFLVGNGIYDYAGSHKTMAYTLRYRAREKRVPHALHIMNTNLQNVQNVVQQAHQFVLDYLRKPIFENVSEELTEKLNIYAQAIHENAQFFKTELENWSPEKDQLREEERQRVLNSAREINQSCKLSIAKPI
ncbi:MAG TPA: hypothetical protein DIC42_00330 [Holosporales bacterium]|nr:hypothetical protein [Holosporales bacterium]